jgi:hypothetical protein
LLIAFLMPSACNHAASKVSLSKKKMDLSIDCFIIDIRLTAFGFCFATYHLQRILYRKPFMSSPMPVTPNVCIQIYTLATFDGKSRTHYHLMEHLCL